MTGVSLRDLAQDVLAPPARFASFLTLTVRPGREDEVRDALADVPGLTRAVGFRIPEALLSCVVGIGSEFWDRAYADLPRPRQLHRFVALSGSKHVAVSTPGDLLLHLRASRQDICFELAHQLMRRLDGSVDCIDEVQGFRYWDERDLLGFVDGTENPSAAAAVEATLVSDDPAYLGSSCVIVQKYLHDLAAWDALSVEEQERVVGRTKLSDIELPDDVKPANSHVAVNTIVDEDGTEQQIVRDNLPFGSPGSGEFGTYFIGYAADPGITERMLRRMFIGEPVGTYDRILDFSTAVTGCLFFVPPADFLENPSAFALSVPAPHESGIEELNVSDGSLGIGSLRRSGGS